MAGPEGEWLQVCHGWWDEGEQFDSGQTEDLAPECWRAWSALLEGRFFNDTINLANITERLCSHSHHLWENIGGGGKREKSRDESDSLSDWGGATLQAQLRFGLPCHSKGSTDCMSLHESHLNSHPFLNSHALSSSPSTSVKLILHYSIAAVL